MEFPHAALNIQRGLAVVLLAAVLGVAAIERGSPFASRLRVNRPWPFWLSVREPGRSTLHFGIYHPLHHRLILARIPKTTRLQGPLWEGAGSLTLELAAATDDDEPPVAAARALKARGHSPRTLWPLAWRCVAGLLRDDKTAADELLLALELRRTTLESLEPALLPDAAAAAAFLAHAFAPEPQPRSDARAIVIEVLNGAGVQGLAAQTAKVLRSAGGMDVTALGQAPHSRSRTVVYDRTGDFHRAARVRAALGCPTAIASTRIDALRGVDVSVELGGDCVF